MDRGTNPTNLSSQIEWIRRPLQRLRCLLMVYAKPEVVDMIRATLYVIGGEDALQLFRAGCFGHFLDYIDRDVHKRVIHFVMSRQVRVSDPALLGRETWFQMGQSVLRLGLSAYNLV